MEISTYSQMIVKAVVLRRSTSYMMDSNNTCDRLRILQSCWGQPPLAEIGRPSAMHISHSRDLLQAHLRLRHGFVQLGWCPPTARASRSPAESIP